MRIVPITAQNLSQHRETLIDLGDAFLRLVCDQELRRPRELSEEVLATMLATANTGLWLAQDESGAPVGISYFNFGSGYSCGGAYLWINCIYIRDGERRKHYGTRLLEAIEEQARRKRVKLIICSRDVANEGSRRLLARANFSQDDQVVATKVLA